MIEIRLGDRYAKSILDLAVERKEIEVVRKDFIFITELCDASPDFLLMLKSPLVRAGKKQKIIDEVIGERLSPLTKNLVEIVVRKKREPWLLDIALRFLALYDQKMNITRGTLVSAVAINEQQVDQIRTMVESELKTTFKLEVSVNPDLIGGFQLRISDRLFDGSIASKLRELRQEFENNPYVKQL